MWVKWFFCRKWCPKSCNYNLKMQNNLANNGARIGIFKPFDSLGYPLYFGITGKKLNDKFKEMYKIQIKRSLVSHKNQ